MLQVSRLQKSFPGVLALDSVDFEVRAGEVHALVGENGAGKSTLVKILGGGLLPDSGEVRLDGSPLPYGDPKRVRESGIGVIYQELTLVPELSVAANIFLGRERASAGFLTEKVMIEGARQYLERLGCDFDPRILVRDLGVGRCQLVEPTVKSCDGRWKCAAFAAPSTMSSCRTSRCLRVRRRCRRAPSRPTITIVRSCSKRRD